VKINLKKNNSTLKINKQVLTDITKDIMLNYQCTNSSISIILLDKEHLRKLNKKFFEKDEYTDVIAFNLEDYDYPIEGEIYICPNQVNENAKIFKVTFDNELKRVIIHGCLHLLGYEDNSKKEKEKMRTLENYYINKFQNSNLI